jgi:streptogramin lyase
MSLDSRPHVRPIRRLSAMIVASLIGFALVGGTLTGAQAAPAGFQYKTYKVPSADSQPGFITVGSDGNLWFTEGRDFFTPNPDPDTGGTFHSNIGRITPRGDITEFRVDCGCFPHDIVQGPGGLLYFTSNDGLGRISTDGVVQPFIEAPFSVGGNRLVVQGNNIWIGDFNRRSLWRYDVTSGVFTEFPIAAPAAALFGPSDLAVDNSGRVWFGASGDQNQGVIGRLDPAVRDKRNTPAPENVTTFDVEGTTGAAFAVDIATDGKVWFTQRFNDVVGFLDPLSGNEIRLFTTTPGAQPNQLAAAADGSMWFTQEQLGNAANITADGVITEAGKAVGDDPDSGFENALGIAVLPDPDGPAGPERESVWFTMQAANKIASLK